VRTPTSTGQVRRRTLEPTSHATSAKEALVLQLAEMDDRVRLADQLSEEVGPVILINTFHVAPEDVDSRPE
jgi:hypothetical protein